MGHLSPRNAASVLRDIMRSFRGFKLVWPSTSMRKPLPVGPSH
jgi:hypothetical protein